MSTSDQQKKQIINPIYGQSNYQKLGSDNRALGGLLGAIPRPSNTGTRSANQPKNSYSLRSSNRSTSAVNLHLGSLDLNSSGASSRSCTQYRSRYSSRNLAAPENLLPQSRQSSHAEPQFKKPREVYKGRANRPLTRLTLSLADTYVAVSKNYYQKKHGLEQPSMDNVSVATQKLRVYNNGYDDEDHNYIIQVGEIWNDRYHILKVLGKGSFGQVVEAVDIYTRKTFAIKIIKNRRAFHQQAKIEINILQHLNQNDSQDKKNIVRLLTWFEFRNHLCLVYELLSFNLYELLKANRFKGVSLDLVQEFAIQILECLDFLSEPHIKIIHCDLKPENVLLVEPRGSKIKVVDFGSSCFLNQRAYSYIQSRFYRSPEVMLGVPYGLEIDYWSLGCMLVELHSGVPLFNGVNEHDQLCKIREIIGEIPIDFVRRGSKDKISKFFDHSLILLNHKDYKFKGRSLEESILRNISSEIFQRDYLVYKTFFDLIRRLLDYRPELRLKPCDALNHPFFSRPKYSQTDLRFIN